MKRARVGLLILVALMPGTVYAQTPRRSMLQAIEFETGSTEKMAAYGLLTGAAGLLVGGLVGADNIPMDENPTSQAGSVNATPLLASNPDQTFTCKIRI